MWHEINIKFLNLRQPLMWVDFIIGWEKSSKFEYFPKLSYVSNNLNVTDIICDNMYIVQWAKIREQVKLREAELRSRWNEENFSKRRYRNIYCNILYILSPLHYVASMVQNTYPHCWNSVIEMQPSPWNSSLSVHLWFCWDSEVETACKLLLFLLSFKIEFTFSIVFFEIFVANCVG